MPSTLHVTAAGTLIGTSAAARSRTSGKTIFPAGSLRQIGGGLAQDLVLLLQQPVALAQFPQLRGLLTRDTRPAAATGKRFFTLAIDARQFRTRGRKSSSTIDRMRAGFSGSRSMSRS
ncbi:hypothetical protein GCM10017788_64960 [Amycolatopsis acidiphila]|nr:hypothetical protein GCM10017788_64960 [Amycolatopsis acidiphila]